MPFKAPRICACGTRVAGGVMCRCQIEQQRERKARSDAKRPTASQRGYDRNWAKERAIYLKFNPTCRRCNAPATVVDHIMPHKGNMALFWNKANWQPLCSHCHNSFKQSQERQQ